MGKSTEHNQQITKEDSFLQSKPYEGLFTGLGIVFLVYLWNLKQKHNAKLFFLSQVEFHVYNFRLTPLVYLEINKKLTYNGFFSEREK